MLNLHRINKTAMAEKLNERGMLFLKHRKELGLAQEQIGEKVGVSAQVELNPNDPVSADMIHYIVMCLGLFARKYNLTKREACNYLSRFKGLDFSIRNYEAEHQLSLQECVEDMAAICQRNGGVVV